MEAAPRDSSSSVKRALMLPPIVESYPGSKGPGVYLQKHATQPKQKLLLQAACPDTTVGRSRPTGESLPRAPRLSCLLSSKLCRESTTEVRGRPRETRSSHKHWPALRERHT
eukprot:scaffold336_cov384-Prasinococcus_capsulatus_cf.AAC.4